MPPPHLPPPERGESESAPVPGFRRHIGKLFWVGVAIAPLAALLLVLGNGVGPLRAAAVLAVFSVVIIGLSVVLRDDAAMVKDDVEEQLRNEVDRLRNDIDSLRRGVEVSVHRELERVHRELEATRRDSVLRAESTRLNRNRLTGALPAAEDDYPADPRGRGDRPMRAIAGGGEPQEGDPGYDWFGSEGEPGTGPRQDPIRYGAGTYGSARPAGDPSDTGDRPRRPAPANAAGAAQQAGGAKPTGTEYGRRRSGADENAEVTGRRQSYQAGTYGAGGPEPEPEDTSGRRRSGRRRAPEDDAPAYELIDYDDAPPVYTPQRIDAGVYGSRSAGDDRSGDGAPGEPGTIDYSEFWARSGAVPRSESDARGTDGRADGARSDGARAGNARHEGARSESARSEGSRSESARSEGARSEGARSEGARSEGARSGSAYGENGYGDGARRESPRRETDRRDDDLSSASEWSSWRDAGSGGESGGGWDTRGAAWDTGSQRYNRDDPQVITGAITGDVFDVPYTVGGQALTEPAFGAGNGFASNGGFGAGNGFGAQRWDELPDVTPAPQWAPASDRAGSDRQPAAEPSAEFELPSLEHLPNVGGAAPAAEPNNSGGRHARHASADEDNGGRYRSW